MTIAKILKTSSNKLKSGKIALPDLEAEILLAHVLKKPREFLLAHGEIELSSGRTIEFNRLISRRLAGEPVAYLTGRQEFYGLIFFVNKNVLIPRPETELLLDEALKLITHKTKPLTIVDVGTGSGCIAIALAKLTGQKIMAVDLSAKALAVAKKNAKLHGVNGKIRFVRGNLLEPILKNKKFAIGNSPFIILANLPYLTPKQIKKSPSIKCEPKQALDGGADGLDVYRKLAAESRLLKAFGLTLFCEIGPNQAEKIKKIFFWAKKIQIKKDLCGLARLAIIQ